MNLQDLYHMKDVKDLYHNSGTFCLILLIIIIVSGILLKGKLSVDSYFKSLMVFYTVFIAIFFLIITDFDSFWTSVHSLLFSNTLWLFYDAEDLLIRVFPESYFKDLCVCIVLLFFISSAIIYLLVKKKKGPVL